MGCYQITLESEPEGRYQRIATQLHMMVEQVLYSVAQMHADLSDDRLYSKLPRRGACAGI